jgi:hypothetical protein
MAMNCNQVKENLFDAMEPGSAEASHVQSCAKCAAELKSLESTMALLDEWKAPEPSAYFDTRLRARMAEARREESTATQGFWSWLKKPALLRPALVAAMGLAFVVGMNFYQPGSDGLKPPTAAKGTAVADLQALDKNEDLYADFDLLDDVGVKHSQAKTPDQGMESQL